MTLVSAADTVKNSTRLSINASRQRQMPSDDFNTIFTNFKKSMTDKQSLEKYKLEHQQ